MSDEISSPGQLRQYEENQGWLPRQSETPAIGAGGGNNGATLPAPEDVKPITMGRYAQKVNFNKGDYFSHDNKVFYKNPEGKVSLVTGDAMGDVELNEEQTAQLENARKAHSSDKSTTDEKPYDGKYGYKVPMAPGEVRGIIGYENQPTIYGMEKDKDGNIHYIMDQLPRRPLSPGTVEGIKQVGQIAGGALGAISGAASGAGVAAATGIDGASSIVI